jgi:hypothetical protein
MLLSKRSFSRRLQSFNFVFDADQARLVITSLKTYRDKIWDKLLTSDFPFLTVAGPGEPLALRCGCGLTDSKDLSYLFFSKIHAPVEDY